MKDWNRPQGTEITVWARLTVVLDRATGGTHELPWDMLGDRDLARRMRKQSFYALLRNMAEHREDQEP